MHLKLMRNAIGRITCPQVTRCTLVRILTKRHFRGKAILLHLKLQKNKVQRKKNVQINIFRNSIQRTVD